MIFQCRVTKPSESNWFAQEAGTPEEAANAFHERYSGTLPSVRHRVTDGDGIFVILFARIEVEGHGEWISRVYVYGIFRGGGVPRRPPMTLQEIAEVVGLSGPPEHLLEPGWVGEETHEEAEARRDAPPQILARVALSEPKP